MLDLHVSGDTFVHLQEHFDFMYRFLEQCTDCAVCCRPVTQIERQHSEELVHYSKKLYIGQNSPEDGRICHPKHIDQAY